jgi:HTH-type transcriptional regulator/antitoxin HigA
MPPRAIGGDAEHDAALAMIDRLMANTDLSPGQASYLETLVQLVEVYESRHHAIETSGIDGLASLRHLVDQAGMSAADLARLLGLHPSMGSKILSGDRALTLEHVRTLTAHFGVSADLLVG